jgi:hypothetical protein
VCRGLSWFVAVLLPLCSLVLVGIRQLDVLIANKLSSSGTAGLAMAALSPVSTATAYAREGKLEQYLGELLIHAPVLCSGGERGVAAGGQKLSERLRYLWKELKATVSTTALGSPAMMLQVCFVCRRALSCVFQCSALENVEASGPVIHELCQCRAQRSERRWGRSPGLPAKERQGLGPACEWPGRAEGKPTRLSFPNCPRVHTRAEVSQGSDWLTE